MGYVYIIISENRNAMYIGVTSDFGRRMYEHAHGIYKSSFTKRYRIKHLVHYETYPEIKIAIAREKEIKKWRREKKDNLITKNNPDWNELYNHEQNIVIHYQ